MHEVVILTVVVLRLWDVSQVAGSTQSGALRSVVLLSFVLTCSTLQHYQALLTHLTLIKLINNWYSTPISVEEEPLLSLSLSLSRAGQCWESSFSLEIPHEMWCACSTTSGRPTHTLGLLKVYLQHPNLPSSKMHYYSNTTLFS